MESSNDLTSVHVLFEKSTSISKYLKKPRIHRVRHRNYDQLKSSKKRPKVTLIDAYKPPLTNRPHSAPILNKNLNRPKNFLVRVHPNGDDSRVAYCATCSMQIIFSEATRKLSLIKLANRLFDSKGNEIVRYEDIDRDGEYYVSAGEDFIDPIYANQNQIKYRWQSKWTILGIESSYKENKSRRRRRPKSTSFPISEQFNDDDNIIETQMNVNPSTIYDDKGIQVVPLYEHKDTQITRNYENNFTQTDLSGSILRDNKGIQAVKQSEHKNTQSTINNETRDTQTDKVPYFSSENKNIQVIPNYEHKDTQITTNYENKNTQITIQHETKHTQITVEYQNRDTQVDLNTSPEYDNKGIQASTNYEDNQTQTETQHFEQSKSIRTNNGETTQHGTNENINRIDRTSNNERNTETYINNGSRQSRTDGRRVTTNVTFETGRTSGRTNSKQSIGDGTNRSTSGQTRNSGYRSATVESTDKTTNRVGSGRSISTERIDSRSSPTTNFRVRVFRNGESGRYAYCKSCTMDIILFAATDKLQMPMRARRLFDADGHEIFHSRDIQRDMDYYVSSGSNFKKPVK